MKRSISAFHQDDKGDWVAELVCGHAQHVRHRPPWEVREWVNTEAGRDGMIGHELECRHCEEQETESGQS